jgi:hypothetical protein
MGQFSSTKLRKEIMSKSSLRDYITFYRHKGKQPYLGDMREIWEILRNLDLNFFVELIRCA